MSFLGPSGAGGYWLGGSPCAGKNSVARQLCDRFGLCLHDCDEGLVAHMAAATPQDRPVTARVRGMSWDALWMRQDEAFARQVARQCREHGFRHLAIDDSLPLDRVTARAATHFHLTLSP